MLETVFGLIGLGMIIWSVTGLFKMWIEDIVDKRIKENK
jgi:hypothetical protein